MGLRKQRGQDVRELSRVPRRSVLAAGLVLACIPARAAASNEQSSVPAGRVLLQSRADGGPVVTGASRDADVSADGSTLVFASAAPITADDENTHWDVFVRDLNSGETRRITTAVGGGDPDGGSWQPSVSGDGRWIAFTSAATNLVRADTNRVSDVFVANSRSGAVVRVGPAHEQPNGPSFDPVISTDGSTLAFNSWAFNLVPEDQNAAWDTFTYGVRSQRIELVGVLPGNRLKSRAGAPARPAISSDGSRVAFLAPETPVDDCDCYGTQAWVRLRTSQETLLISSSAKGTLSNGAVSSIGLAPDGRLAAFQTTGTDIDQHPVAGIFLKRLGGRSLRVTKRPDGQPADIFAPQAIMTLNARGVEPTLDFPLRFSRDGRFLVFESGAPDLVAGDGNAAWDIFRFDRRTDSLVRVSITTGGKEALLGSGGASITADGRLITYWSLAPNLDLSDSNPLEDVFTLDLRPICGGHVPHGFASSLLIDAATAVRELEPAGRRVACDLASKGL